MSIIRKTAACDETFRFLADVDPLAITSSLSPDGFLIVEAPIKKPAVDKPVKLQVQHEKKETNEEVTQSDK